MMLKARLFVRRCWLGLRTLATGDAYERYLAHWREHHAEAGGEPLSREAFFKQALERKWGGVNRCC
jgi:uncharacterized short protein YbdD (DUF466 family)